MRISKTLRLAALGVAGALALAACSSSGGAQENTSSDDGGAIAPAAGGTSYTIAMVTHEQAGDTFWDKIRAGAEAAATAHGIDLKYSNDPDGAKQATLIQNAVDSEVDGIATTMATPDSVGPAAQAAAEAGIPVVAFNSGISDYSRFGVGMYFGSDEDLAGQTVGERIVADGGTKTLCVIQAQGSVALDARCNGVTKTAGNTEILYVNGEDLTAVQSTLQAKLQQDPSITDIVTLGAPIAMTALQAKADAGSQATVITFDLNADAAQAIQDGDIEFSIDQQPYVQGYMAVTALWLNLSNGNDIGGGKPTLTGPSIVDATNIGPIVDYAKNNTR
ncbi:sugar ABC transporter substrate-binding protein [Streptomyces sp. NP160]|uniref:substrate-binding domain-containing protein n=1 Tax=Streptomyces sp. NP160 TaxID=2586637 RepID=UPI001119DCE6|nr:substrate-binding domain-containing protein [Streptomyces sp. NP160]TNM61965.1 sugar ABC transporter substrate-binding protein [Streptomyces sp. NP160]